MEGGDMAGEDIDCAFIVSSEVTIASEGAETLELAFRARVHLVEQAAGFQRIEVWRDLVHPGVFQMVSWWDDADSFGTYMRSAEHGVSHARIPTEPAKPRGTGVRRYALLPDG
jgi:heme oxygenase (mycobilin-producing)